MSSKRRSIPAELQQALEAAQIMVRQFDGTILHWTRGMEHLYGWSAEEAIGRKSHELLATVFPYSLADIEAELANRTEWVGELLHTTKDGSHLVAASHWSLRSGIIVEVDNDVTSQRRALEARQYLANIVDSSDDAIIGKTLDGVITSWNHAAQLMFGYSAEEIVGKPITLLAPPERLEEQLEMLRQIGRGERIEHFETIRIRKDGTSLPVSLTISPIIGPGGRILGASKIVRDISERKQALIKLQQIQSELFHVSRLNTVSHMAAGLAHELNQPLSAISNYLNGAQRLLGDPSDDQLARVKSALGKAADQALRAGEVVKRLRSFVTRGEIDLKAESMFQIARETSQLASLGNPNVRIDIRLDDNLDRVFANRTQVQQVMLNLMRNAIEAMEDSERRELTIITAAAEPGMVQVGISDTGSGIAEDAIESLFQPFVSAKRNGMGIGLSISKTIIEAHGGRIWIEPNPCGGTIFKFTLRLAEEDALSLPTNASI
jgi:two-component system sensor kinase FixL